MREGGGTALSRVHRIVQVSRQRLPSKAFLRRLGCILFVLYLNDVLLKRLFDICTFCLRLSVINIREYESTIEEQWWVRVSCERFFLHYIYTSLHLSVRCSILVFGVSDFDSNFMGCYLRESWILLIVDNLIFEIWKADLG